MDAGTAVAVASMAIAIIALIAAVAQVKCKYQSHLDGKAKRTSSH
jgi:hypothetical protein